MKRFFAAQRFYHKKQQIAQTSHLHRNKIIDKLTNHFLQCGCDPATLYMNILT